MNKQTFISLLKKLKESHWQAIVDGEALQMVDDLRLEIGALNLSNIILDSSSGLDAVSLREKTLEQADELLSSYYLTHPLTRKGFTIQARALVEQYGGLDFAAPLGSFPERTLFVEGGELIAENRDSPRHRYGAFCELENTFDNATILVLVNKWIESGAAHERYLEMNVCRYSC
ncbi:hypothetical protein [uncultured Cocleimonas sp.]|uniref:hypothetical protein n=1 Tax=uncultured Cocleimonas sp. TaxID=1051587 RepID=UPI0026161DC5|nr:hypothetical protein [uncultured Cocleimonas sp.]